MVNVLPEETLRAVRGGFRDRLLLVGALVFLGLALLSCLALLPAYIALRIEQDIVPGNVTTSAMPDQSPQSKAERADIMRSEGLVKSITPYVAATSSPTQTLITVLSMRPRGVQIDHVHMSSPVGGRAITIEGVAPGRDEINQYREALAKNPGFRSVSVPVGALVAADGGKFSITITGTF